MAYRYGGRQVNICGLKADAGEIIEKRTEKQVVFDNLDGTHQYLCFGSPIHYKDVNDNWQAIDTCFKESKDKDIDIEFDQAIYGAKLVKSFDTKDWLITLNRKNHVISYSPISVSYLDTIGTIEIIGTPQKVVGVTREHDLDSLCPRGSIEWMDAFGKGLSFIYEPNTHFCNKTLIIDNLPMAKINPEFLSLTIRFISTLNPKFDNVTWNKTNKIEASFKSKTEFKDSLDNLLWEWRSPISTDVNGEQVDCKLQVESKDGKQLVNILVPYEWLVNAAYPVRVDPDTYYAATTDGHIAGQNGTYATARGTSVGFSSTYITEMIGQNRFLDM